MKYYFIQIDLISKIGQITTGMKNVKESNCTNVNVRREVTKHVSHTGRKVL